MKIGQGIIEEGTIVGNNYDKYNADNCIVRYIMQKFDYNLSRLVSLTSPKTIHEIGCGEGYWVCQWVKDGRNARGSDFSKKIIEIAKKNALQRQISPERFSVRSIYDLRFYEDSADLLVCCEVLEHLEYPEKALEVLKKITTKHIILSVPNEPIWRICNHARGRYVKKLGNTPGHIQHWSSIRFLKLVENYFDILDICHPFPWTMTLCRSKS